MKNKTMFEHLAALVLILGLLRAQEKSRLLLVVISIGGLQPGYVAAVNEMGQKCRTFSDS